jgi:hypothetical protein
MERELRLNNLNISLRIRPYRRLRGSEPGCGCVVQIEAGKSPGAQLASATKVSLVVFVILTIAALVG